MDSSLIQFGSDTCGNLADSEHREWLVTNGIGGYAMGTVAGMRTRSYHGLLIAALQPPLGRTLMLAALEETLTFDSTAYALSTNRWQSGTIAPEGYQHIENFRLEGTMPVWVYTARGIRFEKRIWMLPGQNATYIHYTLLEADGPVELTVRTLANYRDHHATSDGGLSLQADPVPGGVRVAAAGNATPFYILSHAEFVPQHERYDNLLLDVEAERGVNALDTNQLVGTFYVRMHPGESIDIIANTTGLAKPTGEQAYRTQAAHEQALISKAPVAAQADATSRHLVLAADQFIVKRTLAGKANGCSIIAGYPWFGDWGRDTMISLPGLLLDTGRHEQAAQVLRTFSQFVDQGMLPNRFPDTPETPEYNTVDATLWYFQAIRAYYERTGDTNLVRELFPVLDDIVDWHVRGTRHHIHVDPADQLLYAGEPGTQLTWMDAKYNDWVVTPRIGKPVEINALWYNALRTLADFAHMLGLSDLAARYGSRADQVGQSFARFWNDATGYCYDVLDGPDGHESALRPNQLLAVSLPYSPLSETQQRAIVDAAERSLLTPFGLRSLAPTEPGYIGHYEGGTEKRDGSYHQGTAWAWLIGPFVEAHLRVYGDLARGREYLEPLLTQHFSDFGLGSISEIFDGDEPFSARGCPEQAWSVAELLHAWLLCTDA